MAGARPSDALDPQTLGRRQVGRRADVRHGLGDKIGERCTNLRNRSSLDTSQLSIAWLIEALKSVSSAWDHAHSPVACPATTSSGLSHRLRYGPPYGSAPCPQGRAWATPEAGGACPDQDASAAGPSASLAPSRTFHKCRRSRGHGPSPSRPQRIPSAWQFHKILCPRGLPAQGDECSDSWGPACDGSHPFH